MCPRYLFGCGSYTHRTLNTYSRSHRGNNVRCHPRCHRLPVELRPSSRLMTLLNHGITTHKRTAHQTQLITTSRKTGGCTQTKCGMNGSQTTVSLHKSHDKTRLSAVVPANRNNNANDSTPTHTGTTPVTVSNRLFLRFLQSIQPIETLVRFAQAPFAPCDGDDGGAPHVFTWLSHLASPGDPSHGHAFTLAGLRFLWKDRSSRRVPNSFLLFIYDGLHTRNRFSSCSSLASRHAASCPAPSHAVRFPFVFTSIRLGNSHYTTRQIQSSVFIAPNTQSFSAGMTVRCVFVTFHTS